MLVYFEKKRKLEWLKMYLGLLIMADIYKNFTKSLQTIKISQNEKEVLLKILLYWVGDVSIWLLTWVHLPTPVQEKELHLSFYPGSLVASYAYII